MKIEMKNESKDKKGGNGFFWGFIFGVIFATLLTTKRGRKILREISELSLEMIENFIDEKVGKENKPPKIEYDEEAAREDIESEITQDESESVNEVTRKVNDEKEEIRQFSKDVDANEIKSDESNGHKKKRLFRGIRRTK